MQLANIKSIFPDCKRYFCIINLIINEDNLFFLNNDLLFMYQKTNLFENFNHTFFILIYYQKIVIINIQKI